jgi:hypothetical protein
MDRNLWKPENYPAFLEARRELLANAANEFLESLLVGTVVEERVIAPVLERPVVAAAGGIEGEDEELVLRQCNQWIAEQGLPEGEIEYELVDPKSGETVAILDLAWPNGLQEGYSQPVALLIDEPTEVEEAVNRAGFQFFTKIDSFHDYVNREILAVSEN